MVLESLSVMHLTDEIFDRAINTRIPILVMFYSPHCIHCVNAKPEFMKAADELGAEGYPAKLALLDASRNHLVLKRYKIERFPTFKLFKNGKMVEEYDGQRLASSFKEFIKKWTNTFR